MDQIIIKDHTTALPKLTGNRAHRVEQIVKWFFENFEDPAERTPYETAEGGYIFIWGEVYAREEIEEKFHKFASEAVINDAVEQIEHDGDVWVPVPHPSDYE
jgi:DNA-binding transcriptional regulator YbjK